MSDTAPVLIAYDGSEASRHAIAGSAPLLSGRRTLIVVARSSMESVAARIEGHDAITHEPDDPAERAAAEGVRLARAAGLDADGLVVTGDGSVGQTISDTAERLGASLIVLGSRANHGLRSLALGSVSRHVVHDARRPTLVVPDRAPADPGRRAPGSIPAGAV